MEGKSTVAQRAGKWLDLFHVKSKERSEIMFLLLKCRFAKDDAVPAEIIPSAWMRVSGAVPVWELGTSASTEPFHLYIGSIGAAVAVREGTCPVRVTHVLTAAASLKPPAPAVESKTVPLLDAPTQDIRAHFEESSAWIASALAAGGSVLVHCFAGKSRSATLIAAFLMSQGHALASCLELLRARRPVIMPNIGFLRQLAAYEAELVSRGVIPQANVRPVPDWAVAGAARRVTHDAQTEVSAAEQTRGVAGQGAVASAAATASPLPPLGVPLPAVLPPVAADVPPFESASVARSSRTSAEMSEALGGGEADSPTLSAAPSPFV
ncbi:DSPTP1, partial [Symbiodinium sp. KB8]